jgi:hypothetical protein
MTQVSIWQQHQHDSTYAELCNALYERELRVLSQVDLPSAAAVQARLKSLPYYINRAAYLMSHHHEKSPLQLDVQNASWSMKQINKIPLAGQDASQVKSWYNKAPLTVGLVVPVIKNDHIILDCIDRVDLKQLRFRTNISGWFSLAQHIEDDNYTQFAQLLKPNKKVMSAACAGHCWQRTTKLRPIVLSLRELLLSCSINWKDFKTPLTV